MKIHHCVRWLIYVWPLPCSLLGFMLGVIPFLGERQFIFRQGTLGIYGPAMGALLRRAPINGGAMAITFGHVILAIDADAFDSTFEHEWIHVKQYQWWGPLFLIAYPVNSGWQWLRGRHSYLDNAFEVQARKFS